jgi:hypothetical protein
MGVDLCVLPENFAQKVLPTFQHSFFVAYFCSVFPSTGKTERNSDDKMTQTAQHIGTAGDMVPPPETVDLSGGIISSVAALGKLELRSQANCH